ncbi:anion permease [Candidatus Woesearchaeota archaeon]|nr:anion permease [Candidatus Woesearchaeota archaeon]
MDFLTLALIFVALYIGWNIGANHSANCFGTTVGAGIISYGPATLLVAIFALIGAVMQGYNNISTVGNGIVNANLFEGIDIVAGLFGAALLITYFTFKGLPVSTTQTVIGAIVGVGLFNNLTINWGMLRQIFFSWIATPFIAIFLAIMGYLILSFFFGRGKFLFIEKKLRWLILLSGMFMAYSLGANNIGNSVGLIVQKGIWIPFIGALFGGIALGVGSMTFGRRVMATVGSGITELDERMAFCAQFGAGITLYLLTMFNIPASSSHAIVGGVIGTGLVKGLAMVDRSEIFRILQGWIITPIGGAAAGVISLMIMKLIF